MKKSAKPENAFGNPIKIPSSPTATSQPITKAAVLSSDFKAIFIGRIIVKFIIKHNL